MRGWKIKTLEIVLIVCFAVLVIGRFAGTSHIRMATDPAIVGAGIPAAETLQKTRFNWNQLDMLGAPQGPGTGVPSVLQIFLPGIIANNYIYILGCLLASFVFLGGFRKRFSFPAVAIGILAAFWTGSNFTLSYAGHDFKSYVVLFFVCAICAVRIPGWLGGTVWGGFAGLMFAQQPDIALFFGMVAGSHLLFTLWGRHRFDWLSHMKVLGPAAVTALLLAAPPLLSGYVNHVKDTAQVQTETPQEKWNYVTQWSFPADEVIDLIAPNFTGIRSGEPAGPYWGRTGRSAEWSETRQGFMNYRMESVYIGFIPIAFAIFALFGCFGTKQFPSVIFWSCASLVTLMLSFGRYFPLYRLFYLLPIVNNIRNPNKWLQVFQVCLAILTVFGFHRLFFGSEPDITETASVKKNVSGRGESAPAESGKAARWFFYGLCMVSGLLLLAALSFSAATSAAIRQFVAQGWPQATASLMAANQTRSLWHAFSMALIMVIACSPFCLARLSSLRRFRSWIAAALVLVVAVDAYVLSRHYMKDLPRAYVAANPLTDFLLKNRGTERVAIIRQDGIYSIWQNYLLPYHRIPTFTFAAMPRMAIDYRTLLQAGSPNPLRLWQFASVRYLLAPTAILSQIPPGVVDVVFTYTIAGTPDGSFSIQESPRGEHAVFEFKNVIPRYLLVTNPVRRSAEETLAQLPLQSAPLVPGSPQPGAVSVVSYTPAEVHLEVNTPEAGLLRIAERWDQHWRAYLDGEPVPVQRIEHILQGVDIPPGRHDLVLAYRPPQIFFYAQALGLLALIIAGIMTTIRPPSAPSDRVSKLYAYALD